MTATLQESRTVQVPSLAELRAAARDTSLYCLQRHELNALLDIAEAAQAVAHEATFYADDDTPDGSLIVVPREEMKALDNALAKVTP